jgi:hypothetical protein
MVFGLFAFIVVVLSTVRAFGWLGFFGVEGG